MTITGTSLLASHKCYQMDGVRMLIFISPCTWAFV